MSTRTNQKGNVGVVLVAFLVLISITVVVFPRISKYIQTVKTDVTPFLSDKASRENMNPEAKVHFDKAQELFKQMRAVQNDPNAIKPLADQAIAELKLASELDQKNPVIWSELGNAYTWPHNNASEEDALNAFKKAEEVDPGNVVYINFVGDELIRLGRNEEAITQFNKTLRISDSSGYAYISIGKAYFNLKVYTEAKTNLEKGIDILKNQNDDGKYDKDILEAQKVLNSIPK